MVHDSDWYTVLVFPVLAASLLAFAGGYVLAWKSKRNAYRVMGSLLVAASSGLFGLLGLAWFISAVLPFRAHGPDRLLILALSSLPLGLLYVSVKFIWRALKWALGQ